MTVVTIHTARTALLQLLARVEAGEEILLARRKQPVAKLAPLTPARPRRRFGVLRGRMEVGDACFDPLPEAELAAWE